MVHSPVLIWISWSFRIWCEGIEEGLFFIPQRLWCPVHGHCNGNKKTVLVILDLRRISALVTWCLIAFPCGPMPLRELSMLSRVHTRTFCAGQGPYMHFLCSVCGPGSLGELSMWYRVPMKTFHTVQCPCATFHAVTCIYGNFWCGPCSLQKLSEGAWVLTGSCLAVLGLNLTRILFTVPGPNRNFPCGPKSLRELSMCFRVHTGSFRWVLSPWENFL